MNEFVILVDETDVPAGTMEKMEAHQKGLLHRAFSAFVFNSKNQLLLQRRASGKYHSAGLWTNTCCSHPRPGEDTLSAALRRLKEEMGFETPLTKKFDFIYKAALDHELTEHEFDHVYTGLFDGEPAPDPLEVSEFKWMELDHVREDLRLHPHSYTEWFKIAILHF
jgi:isopentenyl-diphosphate delta-isomerase